ncbi:hypothetical protein [Anaerosporobacter sp.]
MKYDKKIIWIFTIIAIISLLMSILIEFWGDEQIIKRYLEIFTGHINYISNILIGVFTSCILLIVSTLVAYNIEHISIWKETISNYLYFYSSLQIIYKINNYEILINKIELLQNAFLKSGDLSKHFDPFFKNTRKYNYTINIYRLISNTYCDLVHLNIKTDRTLEKIRVREEKHIQKEEDNHSGKINDLSYVTDIKVLKKELKLNKKDAIKKCKEVIDEFNIKNQNINTWLRDKKNYKF